MMNNILDVIMAILWVIGAIVTIMVFTAPFLSLLGLNATNSMLAGMLVGIISVIVWTQRKRFR